MVPERSVIFRVHAIKHMFERHIDSEHVRHVLAAGITIEDYPDDQPYPSRLMLGWSDLRPIHVVVAYNAAENEMIVITAYEPDFDSWEPGFRERRKP
jgi:hypothetical protein